MDRAQVHFTLISWRRLDFDLTVYFDVTFISLRLHFDRFHVDANSISRGSHFGAT